MSLKVKGIYSDGMVLQRDVLNCAFGVAKAGSTILLDFRGLNFSSVCDEKGNWKIEYEVGGAGGPFELKISSRDISALLSYTVAFNDTDELSGICFCLFDVFIAVISCLSIHRLAKDLKEFCLSIS